MKNLILISLFIASKLAYAQELSVMELGEETGNIINALNVAMQGNEAEQIQAGDQFVLRGCVGPSTMKGESTGRLYTLIDIQRKTNPDVVEYTLRRDGPWLGSLSTGDFKGIGPKMFVDDEQNVQIGAGVGNMRARRNDATALSSDIGIRAQGSGTGPMLRIRITGL